MSSISKPLFVELAGLPAAGKTTTAELVKKRLSERGLRCTVVPEAAEKSPLSHFKRDWRFNAWTLCQAVSSVLEHNSTQNYNVVVLDRGLIDALCWIEWFRSKSEINFTTATILESFVRIPTWFQEPKVIVALRVQFETALSRRGTSGRIVNPQTFRELRKAYERAISELLQNGQCANIHIIDTDELSPNQVLDEVMKLLIVYLGSDLEMRKE